MGREVVRNYRLIVLSLLLLLCAPQSHGQAALPRIAVIPFSAINVSKSDAEVVAGLLETALVKTEVFRVIEQKQLHEILEVQEFSLSDCVSDTCAVEVGQMLSAEQIVLGSLASLGGKFVLNAKIVDVAKGINIRADRVETSSLAQMTEGAEQLAYKLAGLTYRKETEQGIAQEFGSVLVETDPPGAAVLVNGVNRGISPLLIARIPLGFVRIECHKGELYAMEEVRIARGVSKVSLALARQCGNLYIRSSNYAVEVFLDGVKLGKLDSGLYERIPVGQHTLELKGSGLYWAGEVTVQLGEITQIEATPRAVGSISYRLPTGTHAEIRGEGFRRAVEGEGTLTPVWEGAYTIQITGDIYEPYSEEILVERGKEVTFRPALLYNEQYEYQSLSQSLEGMEKQLSRAPNITSEDIDGLEQIRTKIQSARYKHADLLARSEALLSKFEHRRLSLLVEEMEKELSGDFRVTLKDFDLLAGIQHEVQSARQVYTDLQDRVDVLFRKVRKLRQKQEIVNLSKFRIEPNEKQLLSPNPAYLGVLSYAQLSTLVAAVDLKGMISKSSLYLEQYDFNYQGGYMYVSLAYSLPLGRRLGLQASCFVSGPGIEKLRAVKGEWMEGGVGGPDVGGQVSLGWALSDSFSLGAGAAAFLELPSSQKSAFCFGVLFRNADSTVAFDLMGGVSSGRQYLLHAQDARNYLDFGTPYTLGDSVAMPVLVEGTLMLVFGDRRLFLVTKQSNRIFTDQDSYTGRITPGAELWLSSSFALRGALDLSVHKMGGAIAYGSGLLLGISFRGLRGAWCVDLGGSAYLEPIRSIPGVAVYQPPSFYISYIKNLLSQPRKS